MLRTEVRPQELAVVPEAPKTVTAKPTTPKAATAEVNTIATPPKMNFSLYPTCKFDNQCCSHVNDHFLTVLVTPKTTYTCLLSDDSEGTYVTTYVSLTYNMYLCM